MILEQIDTTLDLLCTGYYSDLLLLPTKQAKMVCYYCYFVTLASTVTRKSQRQGETPQINICLLYSRSCSAQQNARSDMSQDNLQLF